MDEQEQQIDPVEQSLIQLLTLFEARQLAYNQISSDIFDHLKDTLFVGFSKFVEIDPSKISLLDIDLFDKAIVVVLTVEIEEGQKPSEIIEKLSPTPQGTVLATRLVRLRVPVGIAVDSEQRVIEYLTKEMNKILGKHKAEEVQKDFDVETLTKEQKEQLMMFQKMNKGAKH